MEECLDVESDPRSVALAREFVRSRLVGWEMADKVEPATLIASELVTNGVLHARTALQLTLIAEETTVRIEVSDDNPRVPTTGACPPDATSGRGLALVSSLASSWGIEHRDNGKVVWAELGPGRPRQSDDCLDMSAFDSLGDAISEIGESAP
jgi:anti-sigma regulatory factor (Ser/Thr protein kinase)